MSPQLVSLGGIDGVVQLKVPLLFSHRLVSSVLSVPFGMTHPYNPTGKNPRSLSPQAPRKQRLRVCCDLVLGGPLMFQAATIESHTPQTHPRTFPIFFFDSSIFDVVEFVKNIDGPRGCDF
jgi:hypothetical protein